MIGECAEYKDWIALFAVETALELVRAHEFPHLPSRRGAVFAFHRRSDAERFVERYRERDCHLYRVRATGEIWYGDLTIRARKYAVRRGRPDTWWPQYKRAARAYWRRFSRRAPPRNSWAEMLVYGNVEVLSEIPRSR